MLNEQQIKNAKELSTAVLKQTLATFTLPYKVPLNVTYLQIKVKYM